MVTVAERPAHQQRVVDEKAELDVKLAALGKFIDDAGFVWKSLDVAERDRLRRQRIAMKNYSHILGERIANF